MCLAIPSKIVKIVDENLALVDFGGVQKEVNISMLEEKPKENDYVLVHIGFAMAVVDEKEALETLRLLAEIQSFADTEQVEQ